MKKAVKIMGMMLGAAVVGAVAGNLFGRAGVEVSVAVPVMMAAYAALSAGKRNVTDKKVIEG